MTHDVIMRALLRGVIPVAPTVFDEDEALDLNGQNRVIDYLLAAGVDDPVDQILIEVAS